MAGAKQYPDFFRRAFSVCAVACFGVRVANWPKSSDIVFVNSATEVLSACVAVAIFSSANMWSCCILVKSTELACAVCKFAAYLSVFEVLDDLWVSLKA